MCIRNEIKEECCFTEQKHVKKTTVRHTKQIVTNKKFQDILTSWLRFLYNIVHTKNSELGTRQLFSISTTTTHLHVRASLTCKKIKITKMSAIVQTALPQRKKQHCFGLKRLSRCRNSFARAQRWINYILLFSRYAPRHLFGTCSFHTNQTFPSCFVHLFCKVSSVWINSNSNMGLNLFVVQYI